MKIFVVDTFVSVKRTIKKKKIKNRVTKWVSKKKKKIIRQIKNNASMKNGELPELNGPFYLELQFSNGKMESSAHSMWNNNNYYFSACHEHFIFNLKNCIIIIFSQYSLVVVSLLYYPLRYESVNGFFSGSVRPTSSGILLHDSFFSSFFFEYIFGIFDRHNY